MFFLLSKMAHVEDNQNFEHIVSPKKLSHQDRIYGQVVLDLSKSRREIRKKRTSFVDLRSTIVTRDSSGG